MFAYVCLLHACCMWDIVECVGSKYKNIIMSIVLFWIYTGASLQITKNERHLRTVKINNILHQILVCIVRKSLTRTKKHLLTNNVPFDKKAWSLRQFFTNTCHCRTRDGKVFCISPVNIFHVTQNNNKRFFWVPTS